MLNKTRPLQRTSSVPLETRSCTARRPNHIRPGVPPRGVTLDPQCSAALVSMGNDWQHWAQRSRHTPRCPRSPRCSAALVSMSNDWQHWAEWTRRGLAHESNIPKSLIDETSVACCSFSWSGDFFLILSTALVNRARCIAHTCSVPRHRPRHLNKKVVTSLDQPKLFFTAASTSVSSSHSATASEGKAGQVFCSKSGKNREARHSILCHTGASGLAVGSTKAVWNVRRPGSAVFKSNCL